MCSMKRTVLSTIFLLGLVLAPSVVFANVYTEMRDTIRGVTYYSVEVSSNPLTEIQMKGGRFFDTDVMTLGFSALYFDEDAEVSEILMWLRHDGPRRWLVDDAEYKARVTADDQVLELVPLHVSRPDKPSSNGFFTEALEFSIAPEAFKQVSQSKEIVISFNTIQGTVSKTLTALETESLEAFLSRAQLRHERLQK